MVVVVGGECGGGGEQYSHTRGFRVAVVVSGMSVRSFMTTSLLRNLIFVFVREVIYDNLLSSSEWLWFISGSIVEQLIVIE